MTILLPLGVMVGVYLAANAALWVQQERILRRWRVEMLLERWAEMDEK